MVTQNRWQKNKVINNDKDDHKEILIKITGWTNENSMDWLVGWLFMVYHSHVGYFMPNPFYSHTHTHTHIYMIEICGKLDKSNT